jgi:hypothetical protein
MDQQSIVFYLSAKGRSAVAIHDDLVVTLGAEAVSYPSRTRYLPEALFALSNLPDPLPPPNINSMILTRLSSSRSPIGPSRQFASYRNSPIYHLPRATVHK